MDYRVFRALKHPGWFAVAPDLSFLPLEMEPWASSPELKVMDLFPESRIREIDKTVRDRGFYLFNRPGEAA